MSASTGNGTGIEHSGVSEGCVHEVVRMTEHDKIRVLIPELPIHSSGKPHGSSSAMHDTDLETLQVHYDLFGKNLAQFKAVHVAQNRFEWSKTLKVSYHVGIGEIA